MINPDKPPLYNDLETYCEVPLKNGTHAYGEKVEIMLWAYAIGDAPEKVWDVTDGSPMPDDLAEQLADPEVETVWHNGAGFDRHMLKYDKDFDIDLPISRVFDTMACALAHALPGGLATLCEILKVPADKIKDKRGKALIQLFCVSRPKNHKLRRATRETHPQDWQDFITYARFDIIAMREVYKRLPRWNYRDGEFQLYCLDGRINDRGVRVDEELARAAIKAVDATKDKLSRRIRAATNGAVEAVSQRDRLLKHIAAEYGVKMPDMKASTLEKCVNDENLPRGVRELLAMRLEGSRSSVTKYNKLLKAVNADGRLRGLLQWNGAQRTGRWAGRVFQPQNLMRPTMKAKDIEQGILDMKAGCADLFYDNVIELAANAMRGVIIPSPGKLLHVADLANIEGRVGAWLAGEKWKLQAFRDYDTIIGTDDKGKPIRKGYDLYALSYAKAFGITPEEVIWDKDHGTGLMRQIGKVMELFLQYEGGVGAFVTGALTYDIDLEQMAKTSWPVTPEWAQAEARGAWAWAVKKRRTMGLPEEVYLACDGLKRLWRAEHPEIVSYWKEIKNCIIAAIAQPGRTIRCRKLRIQRKGAWLRVVLPSGRALCYAAPKWERGKLTYMGMNQYNKQWSSIYTYGGKQFENDCQAVARDIMAHQMFGVEDFGYDLLLTVHDELITEAEDDDHYSGDDLAALLSRDIEWADGLPLAAEGKTMNRYRKG